MPLDKGADGGSHAVLGASVPVWFLPTLYTFCPIYLNFQCQGCNAPCNTRKSTVLFDGCISQNIHFMNYSSSFSQTDVLLREMKVHKPLRPILLRASGNYYFPHIFISETTQQFIHRSPIIKFIVDKLSIKAFSSAAR